MAGSYGVFAKVGMAASSPATERYAVLSESVQLLEEFVDAAGLTGSRSHPKERVRQGIRRVAGAITLNPTPVDLANLLPRILGTAAVGTTYSLAETVPSFYLEIDRVQNRFQYSTCKMNRATFRSSPGQPVELNLDIVGTDEVVTATAFPAISIDITTNVFMHHDVTAFTIGGNTVAARDVEIVIDNALDSEKFLMSQTLTEIVATDRIISMSFNLPYGDYSARYNPGVSGVAVVLTYTNGAVSMSFSFPAVQFPRISPVVNDRGEIMMQLQGIARKSSSTDELTVTLDSSP